MSPRAAPMRVRMLAGTIDALLGVAVVLSLVMAGAAAHVRRRPEEDPRALERRWARVASSPGMERAKWGLTAAIWLVGIVRRNSPTPGQRRLHLRTVDAGSGGPVRLRSCLIRILLDLVTQRIVRLAAGPIRGRAQQRRAATREQIAAYRGAHPDAGPRDEALLRLQRQASPGCAGPVAISLVPGTLDMLSAWRSADGRTWRDRFGGTVVVRDPVSRASR
jgi:hypothetical protein